MTRTIRELHIVVSTKISAEVVVVHRAECELRETETKTESTTDDACASTLKCPVAPMKRTRS